MATGVMCSVVQLAQHPPPVHVPLEHIALPIPIPGIHALARRAVKERPGGGGSLRSHRPVFQPFQLKPRLRGQSRNAGMGKASLLVMGPRGSDPQPSMQRSVTAPPVIVSSIDKRQDEDKGEVTRSHQSSLSLRDLLTPATKRSLATFPARPPISKGKQVPGRFFPKPILTEEQKAQLEVLKRSKPSKLTGFRSASPVLRKPDSSHGVGIFNSLSTVTRMEHQESPSYNQRIVTTRMQLQKDQHEAQPEVFAICFKQDMDSKDYDPASELHSDYYSIKRLKMPMSRLGRPVYSNTDDFAVVLRGHRKHLHKKSLLSMESIESLPESVSQPFCSRGSSADRIALVEKQSLRKMVQEKEEEEGKEVLQVARSAIASAHEENKKADAPEEEIPAEHKNTLPSLS